MVRAKVEGGVSIPSAPPFPDVGENLSGKSCLLVNERSEPEPSFLWRTIETTEILKPMHKNFTMHGTDDNSESRCVPTGGKTALQREP